MFYIEEARMMLEENKEALIKPLFKRYYEKFPSETPAFYFMDFKENKHNVAILENAIKRGKPLSKIQLINRLKFEMYDDSLLEKIDLPYVIERYEKEFGKNPLIGYGFEPNSVVEVEFLIECLVEKHPLTSWQCRKISEMQKMLYTNEDGTMIVY